MEDFARGAVAGFAVSAAVPTMYYFNKAALGTLFAVNKEIGKAIARIIIPATPTAAPAATIPAAVRIAKN